MSLLYTKIHTVTGYTSGDVDIPFTFDYLDDGDIKVYKTDTSVPPLILGTDWVFKNKKEITLLAASTNFTIANNDVFQIQRETQINEAHVTYAPGSPVRAEDLNDNQLQSLYAAQEREDRGINKNGENDVTGRVIFRNNVLGFEGDNSDDYETFINVVEPTQDQFITIPNITGTLITNADTGTVTSQMIADGTIVNADINASADIDGSKIAAGTIDFDRIKDVDIIVESEQDQASPAPTDNNIFSAAAIAKRSDTILTNNGVLPTAPSPGSWQNGKLLYDSSPGSEVLKIWTGSTWVNVSAGLPFTPPTSANVLYVNPDPNIGNDYNSGSSGVLNRGVLPQRPLRTIKGAVNLINSNFDVNDGAGAQGDGDGTLIILAAGVYQETLPIVINKNDVSIVGIGLRSTFVQPTQATESNTMFECNSGTLLANMTFVGLKASGTRGNSTYDSDSTYGLPENQGWVAAFKSGATIRKSPYIQNCTSFNDSTIDNSVAYDPQNLALNADGLGGDTTSAMTGGGILCDGSTPASSSPLRSFVVDSFTQVNLDGPGILCTNNGYAQLVSFFGTFCHYHAKALNGGQLNLSNCTTDFGRYGLIADGKSATNIFTATADGTTAAGQVTFTITGTTADASWHGDSTNPRPLDNMLVQLGGNANGTGGTIYPILSSAVNGSGYDVTISNPDPTNLSNNLGLAAQLTTGTDVRFFLRSQISTGGHTFEYCGSGTNYSGHPDNGGVAVQANQAVNLNDGKVWQSSTDENGRFAVGSTFIVDQKTGNVTIPAAALNVVPRTSPTGAAIMPAGTTSERDASPVNGYLRYNSTDNQFEGYINGSWSAVGGGGVSDGDKGDITVSSSGATWTIDSDVVTYDKMQDLATANRVLGGTAAGTIAEVQVTGDMIADDTITEAKLDVHDTPATGEVLGYTSNGLEWVAQGGGGVDDLSDGYLSTTAGHINLSLGHTGNPSFTESSGDGASNLVINTSATSITSGSSNTAVGVDAGKNINTADFATYIGNFAGHYINASRNTAVGHLALTGGSTTVADNTGTNNTAVGMFALYSHKSGSNNTAVGQSALVGNSAYANFGTGSSNTGVGHYALHSIADGDSNVAVGNYALAGNFGASGGISGDRNIAIGDFAFYSSGASITSGSDNIALGYSSLYANKSGSTNIAIGKQALYTNGTGLENIAIGREAGYLLSSSSYSIYLGNEAAKAGAQHYGLCIGHQVAYTNTSGSYNTIVGGQAAYYNVSGATGYHAILGWYAGGNSGNGFNVCLGSYSGNLGTSASNNTAVGSYAMDNGCGGSNNTCVGYQADPSSTIVSNEITLGNSSVATLRCQVQTISSLSDGRDKTEVEDLPLGLDFIDSLRPVKFKWETREGLEKDGTYDAGFIAQDLQSAQTNSDAEYLNMVLTSNPDRLEAAYGRLIPVLVQAVKDLKAEIDTLKANA